MRIVVFHQGALGDFLVAMSALEGVFTSKPGTVVDFWSKRDHFSLLSGKKYRGDFHSLDGPFIPSLLDDSAWKTALLPEFLIKTDHLLVVGQEGSRLPAERLSARLRARVDWVRSFPPSDHAGSHAFDYICAQLSKLGLSCGKGCLSLTALEAEIFAAMRFLEERGIASKPVLVHPGSGGRRKIWPLVKWRDLLHWLAGELSLPVLLSVGPADECLRAFAERMSGGGITLLAGISTARLAAFISLCGLYFGGDSGVSHLAAAIGVPSVVIFGTTDPSVWAPRGECVRILRGKWSEREIFEWDPSGPPGEPDPEVLEMYRSMVDAGLPGLKVEV